jgi:adenine-specific DNA-methyltransferase
VERKNPQSLAGRWWGVKVTENEQLLQNLIETCSEETAKAFFRRKNIHFKAQNELLENSDPEKFSNVRKLGQLDFADTVLFAFADVKAELSERSCRKAQFDAARKILRSENADAGLFIFRGANGAFRLSLVYKAYSGTKAELSPYRRFTYFVQPGSTGNTTFRRQLGGCAFDSLEAIKKSFSIEAVSKEFYRELSNWYFWALKHIRFPEQNDLAAAERNPVCTIRLITRLMFVWFMKQMHLIPGEFFDRKQLGNMLKSINPEESTYYKAVLQNLFFATLNTEMDHSKYPRRFRTSRDKGLDGSYGIHSVYRYRNLFTDPDTTLERFKTVPFLNGGLFECLDNTEVRPVVRIDGFSDRPDNQLIVPNFLFFGEEHAEDLSAAYGDKKHKKEKVSGLLDILSRYNFTVIENTPHESEVALDPELLGMVFENLLAAYNPETGATARKQTGSFYTPREIVSYMVDESLVAYLKNALATEEDIGRKKAQKAQTEKSAIGNQQSEMENKLRELLSYDAEGNPFDEAETETLIAAVDACKILDPACGSGAFPMGALHKLVLVLSKLDPGNERWLQTQLEKLDDVTMRDELERNFRENAEDYGRKLCLIENCIYGVDIQPIACQISKLRFFISLLCDQIVNPVRPNLGIRPLPNLETKFVAANTLIGLERPKEQQFEFGDDVLAKKEIDLAKVRHEHFKARTPKTKQKYRELDKKLRGEIRDLLVQKHWKVSVAKQIAEWNPYDQNASAPFFDPEWMFAIIDGFDIVIGNPPYVRQEDIKEYKPVFQKNYSCYTGTADLFVYFFERGVQLLAKNGVQTYICSNKYFRAGYGKKLRQFLAENMQIRRLIDFGDAPVFEATAYPSIIVMSKGRDGSPSRPESGSPGGHALPGNEFLALNWTPGDPVSTFMDVFRTRAFPMLQSHLTADGWQIEHPQVFELMQKLRAAGKPLGKYVDGKFYRGILTGFNEAFVIDRTTRDRLITEDPNCNEIIKPFLRGRDVKRWRTEPQDLWLIFTRRGIEINSYPAVKKHLSAYKNRLMPGVSGGRKPGSYEWYEIQDNIAYWQEFEKPKILYQEISTFHAFAWDDSGYFTNNKCFLIPGASLFLLGVLNVPSSWWFIGNLVTKLNGGAFEMRAPCLAQVPIPAATPAQQKEIEALVEQILALKKEDPSVDVSALEAEIDQLVYKLYDLTPEEIDIVESNA